MTRVPVDFDDDIVEMIAAHALHEGRSVDKWLDWHFRHYFYGSIAMLPPMAALPIRFTRQQVSIRTRREIYKQCGGVCAYCNRNVDPFNFEVDHVVPVFKGGKSDLSNLVGACKSCNRKKHIKDAEEFRALKVNE